MTPDQEKTGTSDSRFCAHCGTENKKSAYACDRCGERIYLPDVNSPPPLGLVECQKCLTANEARASYCVNCGNSLATAARISLLGGGESGRRAPRSDPAGIRISQRGRDPSARRRAPEQERPREKPPAPEPERATRTREPRAEQAQRESARKRAEEQERQRAEASSENNSGTRSAHLPQSARGWNTAAFLIGPIWGPSNGVWLGIIGLVFFFIPSGISVLGSLGMKFTLYLAYGAFLGFRGNEMAWRAKRWQSLEHFKRVQQQWMLLALVVNLALLFIVPILLSD